MIDPNTLTAADVMTTDLITLEEDTSIEEAVALLEDHGVSGAPVVNRSGECRGVFTITDVVSRRIEVGDGEAPTPSGWFNFDPLDEEGGSLDKDGWDLAGLERDTVGQWMTGELHAVTADTSIAEVCRVMARESIHRVLILEGKAVRGIISSLDIVGLVAGLTADERGVGRVRGV